MTTGRGTLDCPPARTLISAARARRGLPLTPVSVHNLQAVAASMIRPQADPGSGSGGRHDRGVLPGDLGAVIRRTVLSGELPAWLVIHEDETDWCVGDDVNDPDVPGASVIAHMTHVLARGSSVPELASFPPGWAAARTGTGQPWERLPHQYRDERRSAAADHGPEHRGRLIFRLCCQVCAVH